MEEAIEVPVRRDSLSVQGPVLWTVGGGDVLYYVRSPRSALAGGFGSPGFAGEASLLRMCSLQWHLKTCWSPKSDPPSLPSGAFVPGSEGGFVLVDGEEPSSQRDSIRDTRSGSTPVLGHIKVGMGHTPPRSSGVRGVVGAGEVAAHQSSRNEGIVYGIAAISGVGRRSPCGCDVR